MGHLPVENESGNNSRVQGSEGSCMSEAVWYEGRRVRTFTFTFGVP